MSIENNVGTQGLTLDIFVQSIISATIAASYYIRADTLNMRRLKRVYKHTF